MCASLFCSHSHSLRLFKQGACFARYCSLRWLKYVCCHYLMIQNMTNRDNKIIALVHVMSDKSNLSSHQFVETNIRCRWYEFLLSEWEIENCNQLISVYKFASLTPSLATLVRVTSSLRSLSFATLTRVCVTICCCCLFCDVWRVEKLSVRDTSFYCLNEKLRIVVNW